MRPILLSLVLLAGVAAAQQRTVAEILIDHAGALGDTSAIRSLKGTGNTNIAGLGFFRHAETYLSNGACYRNLFQMKEYVSKAGVFAAADGLFERFRVDQESTRGAYHLQVTLADPFPLSRYLGNPGAQRELSVVFAKGFEVLKSLPDAQGFYVLYLLDPKTHLLSRVRYESSPKKQSAILTYSDYRPVRGAMLPHVIDSRYLMQVEDEKKRASSYRIGKRTDQYIKWEVDPDLKGIDLDGPGLGRGGAKGFERVEFRTGIEPYEAGIGDLDGDGKRDIAVACWGGVTIHFGGAEDKPVFVPLGKGHHRGMVVEDFDLDGRDDVLTTSWTDPPERFFFVTFGGDRTPGTRERSGAPLFGYDLAAADFDRDGIADVVSSGWGNRRIYINFGNGVGGFRVAGGARFLASERNPDPRGFGIGIGRLDRDDLLDIVVADGKRLRPFQGNPLLAFQAGGAIKAGPRPVDVCFVDLDNDGLNELLVANDMQVRDLKGDIAILKNSGEGLVAHDKVEAGYRTPCVAAGHLDGDGFPDAVAPSYLTGEVTLLLGDGKCGLSEGGRLRSGRGVHRVLVTDLDGDGMQDILASNKLDDTITLFLNRGDAPEGVNRSDPSGARIERAEVCRSIQGIDFELKGLSSPYAFVAEFRLPARIRDPSGIAFMGGDPSQRQFVLVSDKEPSLFRAVLDVAGKRLLVGPRIPLTGAPEGRLDLEEIAYDRHSGNVLLASEARSSVLRATLFGHVLGEAATDVQSGGNDGIEGLALRRRKDGTPLLYVFKERYGKTLKPPPVYVYGVQEDPFALVSRADPAPIPFATPDQSAAAVFGENMFVVCRLRRTIAELSFDGLGFAKTFKSASFLELTDDKLGWADLYGIAEAITVDAWGDLFLMADNNRKVYGKEGINRGPEGRLVWFRNLKPPKERAMPRRVEVSHIFIPFQGASGAPETTRTREEAGKLAEELLRRIRHGESFDELAAKHHHASSPRELKIVQPPDKPGAGEWSAAQLDTALARLAFALDPGEVGICEYHSKESPHGWHLLLRTK